MGTRTLAPAAARTRAARASSARSRAGRRPASLSWASALWASALWASALWASALWASALWASALWASLLWSAVAPDAAAAQIEPDFSRGAPIPLSGLPNPYRWTDAELAAHRAAGAQSAIFYPVDITPAKIPLRLLRRIAEPGREDPLRAALLGGFRALSGWESVDDVEAWLGLMPFPARPSDSPNPIPFPVRGRPGHRIGAQVFPTADGAGLTFGCPACHAGELFGQAVMGLPNRISRANEFFVLGDRLVSAAPAVVLGGLSGASRPEMRMLADLREAMASVEARTPLALGLDTALAQVALSLSHRANDPWASPNPLAAVFPRYERLRHRPGDSKPAPWWNVRYKNRWLLDGSVVSGNPIVTNILWNELGRGTDLRALARWMHSNEADLRDLTTYVYAAEPPLYTDYLGVAGIDLARARSGQRLFEGNCARCHGFYKKGWDLPDAASLRPEELLRTVEVAYHTDTPVLDVGTDPYRARAMASLEQLNGLALSQAFGVVVERQEGYIPPPLVGVWSRWPYFHNGSGPTLCAVLTRSEDRPRTWYVGRAHDPDTDFDRACNGFPAAGRAPRSWRRPAQRYDAGWPGTGNQGHDEGIFLDRGREIYTPAQKRDLVTYLKTL